MRLICGSNEMKTSRMRWFWACALAVVLLDQACKVWVRQALPLGESRPAIAGWLSWTHVQNHGAAWGVLEGQRWLLVGVAALVILIVAGAARDLGLRSPLSNVGLSLVLGGAIGNLADRVRQGFVTDFVDLETPWRVLREFPVWNVADAALTIGVALLAIDFLRLRPDRAPAIAPTIEPAVGAAPMLVGEGEGRE